MGGGWLFAAAFFQDYSHASGPLALGMFPLMLLRIILPPIVIPIKDC